MIQNMEWGRGVLAAFDAKSHSTTTQYRHLRRLDKSVPFPSVGRDRWKILPLKTGVTFKEKVKVKSPYCTSVARNSYLTNKPEADGALIPRHLKKC